MRVAATVVLAVVLLLVADATAAQDDLVAQGQQLYDRSCVGCHGIGGGGTEQGPPLLEAGAASTDFMLTTGRMPLSRTGIQPPRKEPAFDPEEIVALVAYVASLGTGPAIPDIDPDRGDLAFGGELYRLHCAACHNAAGVGVAEGFAVWLVGIGALLVLVRWITREPEQEHA
jgi:ubiquinol-cytochrome c reductase cytochrome c subunit